MKTLKEFLTKVEIYPFSATPHVSQHIEDEVLKAVTKWLMQFQNEVDQLPTVDDGQIDYRNAQQDLMKKLLTIKLEKIEGDPVSYLLKRAQQDSPVTTEQSDDVKL